MPKFLRLKNSTLEDYKAKNIKDLWEKVKNEYSGFQLECFTKIEKARGEDNKFHAIFSTSTEDRHGDIVEQEWELKNFKRNPVFLDSHNYNSIEHIIGMIKPISVKDGKLQGDIVFAMDNPKGVLAYKLAIGGFLNTTSVGFMPKEFDNEGKILKSELLEVSAVSVPANPQALLDKLYDGENIKNKKGDGEIKSGGDNSKDERNKNKGEEKDKKFGRDEKDNGESKEKKFETKYLNDNWDEGPEFIRLKIRDIGEFEDDSFQREVLREKIPRITGISGISKRTNTRVLQSIFFPKEDGWNIDDAKKWATLREFDLLNGKNYVVKTTKQDKIKECLINIGNKHAEQRKRGLQKVLLAIRTIKASTPNANSAAEERKQEVRKMINKAAKDMLKLKK